MSIMNKFFIKIRLEFLIHSIDYFYYLEDNYY